MRYFLFILSISASLNVHTAKAAEANKCAQYLGTQQDRPPQVKDLLDRHWISALDSDLDAAGELEKQRKAEGRSATPEELADILGGSQVHLRSTTLGNGLVYVTIHKADGTEILMHTLTLD
ncbi:MAG: hypothetical protein IPK68_03600 [Bdellovibrionales bacterium]|nr:hypothetical protein [Bdellovibrionales bacterium]